MYLIPNKEEVRCINMKPKACIKCGLGKDWYYCNFETAFVVNEHYPDYMEVQDFVRNEIDGKTLNIEEAAKKLLNFLRQYKPNAVSVTAIVTNCKTHFDVVVTVGDAV